LQTKLHRFNEFKEFSDFAIHEKLRMLHPTYYHCLDCSHSFFSSYGRFYEKCPKCESYRIEQSFTYFDDQILIAVATGRDKREAGRVIYDVSLRIVYFLEQFYTKVYKDVKLQDIKKILLDLSLNHNIRIIPCPDVIKIIEVYECTTQMRN